MQSLPFIDIIIFAIIAVFLIFRLRNILGEKTGFDPKADNQSKTPKNEKVSNVVDFTKKVENLKEYEFSSEIREIMKIDNSFKIDEFISGANTFFKMVVNGFVEGNIENIKKYVKPKIFKDFQNAIDERIKEKEKLIIDILSINHTKIKNIKIKGNIVKLEVIFDTVQIKALQDINDEIIDGDLDEKIVVKDMWTFERNFKLQSKNWTLIETSTN
jgi:predicted lipid-binding transport protein (Tim44 family)|tara:strand:+ start:224 stop:868 length:645 start_codon:yes stop_codon:yes gene_type:complete